MGDDAGGADPVTAYLGRPAGRIMLLGTFHIHNPGHDAYKPRFTLDVFTARRQREIADVVEGNRNLRIVANLQRITEQPEEKILLVIGAGHLAILRHCVQASPEYDLVEVQQYLTPGRNEPGGVHA